MNLTGAGILSGCQPLAFLCRLRYTSPFPMLFRGRETGLDEFFTFWCFKGTSKRSSYMRSLS